MTVHVKDWVGRSLMAVRRLRFEGPNSKVSAEGAIEFVWDDRSILRIDAVHRRLSVTDRPWRDPFLVGAESVLPQEVARVGRWVRHDVSRSALYDHLIGSALSEANADLARVGLAFGASRVEISLSGVDPVVTVVRPGTHQEWLRVEWRHDNDEEPVFLYYEILDGVERRKVEVWGDGHRGAASAYVEVGGSGRSDGQPMPSLGEINADPQFAGQAITAERFEQEWQAALRGIPTTTLWRPTGATELALVKESGCRHWPPRLPDQPIFYPVTTREYAERIAREWNVPAVGIGYVTRSEVVRAFMDRYAVQQAGGSSLTEWWVPAEELEDLNDHIVGTIEVVTEVGG